VGVVLSGRGGCGEFGSMFGGCVLVVLSAGVFTRVVCAACDMSHDSIMTSSVCPSIRHLSDLDKPGAVVASGWNPMRISLFVAVGSRRLSLKYKMHVPGMPVCMRNDGESRWPTILGIARKKKRKKDPLHAINERTVKDSFPLPRIDDLIDQSRDAICIITHLDLGSA
jgi:hypothetical protein